MIEKEIRFNFPSLKQFITAPLLINLATAWLLACSLPALAAEITYFYDGDTIKINDGGTEFKLRINDIDAPEKNQSYGKKSRRALMQLCESGEFKATITGQDKYGRKLGKLYCHGEDASLYIWCKTDTRGFMRTFQTIATWLFPSKQRAIRGLDYGIPNNKPNLGFGAKIIRINYVNI